MNLRRLEIFVAVAEELHFNRAAEKLHMAQPPLSQQIRKLEEECRTQLFVRDSRNVRLTAGGELLLRHARTVLAQHAVLASAMKQARDGELGRLRFGFVSSAAIAAVPPVVRQLRLQWPGIELELSEETTDAQIELLGSGALDVGIAREAHPPPGIESTLLRNEPLVVAVSTDHRLAGRKTIRLQELKGESFIAFPRGRISGLFDHISALVHTAGVKFDIAQEAVQFPTILGLVAGHLGIAVVPEPMRAFTIPGLVYLRLDDENAFSRLSLIYRTDMADSPLVAKARAACLTTLTPVSQEGGQNVPLSRAAQWDKAVLSH